jgi:hypothetical protein
MAESTEPAIVPPPDPNTGPNYPEQDNQQAIEQAQEMGDESPIDVGATETQPVSHTDLGSGVELIESR